jgi:uncharacterized protein with PQ loop repeat
MTLSPALLVTLFSAAGAALTAAVSVPQLVRLLRTRVVSGVSASTVGFTAIAGSSWGAYAAHRHLVLLTVSSLIALAANLPMLVILARAGAWSLAGRVVAGAMAIGYAAVVVLWGWPALAVPLVMHVAVQYAPQVSVALRGEDLSGISPASAALLLANGLLWGAAGVFAGDPGLQAWGLLVGSTGAVVWVRVSTTRRGSTPALA